MAHVFTSSLCSTITNYTSDTTIWTHDNQLTKLISSRIEAIKLQMIVKNYYRPLELEAPGIYHGPMEGHFPPSSSDPHTASLTVSEILHLRNPNYLPDRIWRDFMVLNRQGLLSHPSLKQLQKTDLTPQQPKKEFLRTMSLRGE